MLVTVSDLALARGGLRILDGLSFTLVPGQALLLRGPNGIGKTTLLRTLAGLQPPLSGQVDLERESVVYAGHLDGVKPTLTAEENLRFWAGVFGGAAIDTALETFELNTLRNRPAGQLSAGQKRRLGLARLVVSSRKIWLLDEPTVSLDTHARKLLERAVRAHLGSGGGVVAATHQDLDLGQATALDLSQFKAREMHVAGFDEAFL